MQRFFVQKITGLDRQGVVTKFNDKDIVLYLRRKLSRGGDRLEEPGCTFFGQMTGTFRNKMGMLTGKYLRLKEITHAKINH